MLPLTDTHAALCEPYVQLRRRYFSSWLIVGVAFFLSLTPNFVPPTPEARVAILLSMVTLIVFWIRVVVTWFRIRKCSCPSCGNSFLRTPISTWPPDHCQQCGLSIHS